MITAKGLKIQVRGNGPTLVMLHGWGLHSGIWAGLADALSERFSLYLVDLPGHGINHQSKLPMNTDTVLNALFEVPAIQEGVAWLGWSLGGLMALQAAIQRPGQVRWLAILAATPSFVARPHWPHGMEKSVFQRFADDLDADHQQTVERFMALEVHGARDGRNLLRRLRAIAASQPLPSPSALQQGLDVLLTTDLTGQLGQVQCPAAVIGGRRDRIVSPAAIEATVAAMDQATAHVIPGAGHAPHLGHRSELLEIIESLQAEYL